MARRPSDAARQEELWNTWTADPTESTLEPLMKEFERDVEYKVSEFDKAPIPNAAVRSKSRQLVLKGIQTYKPEAPANLRTWVNWQLKKVRSFALQNQNFGRIPEGRGLQIGDFKEVKADLTERLGHPPDAAMLAESLQQFNPKYNWSLAEVTRMENELRADRVASMSLEADTLPALFESEERDVLRYIYYDLSPQEKLVYEYTLGVNGKPRLPAKDIATKIGVSGPKVSRLRASIDKKMKNRGLK
jgi:hypothetical protein